MKHLNSNEIRQLWIDFFKSKNHYFLESASLIPMNDNSLLWINSGVATLKPFFSGLQKPQSPRLVNSQKVIRTNDIENVGKTSRHHTFFEMLGNFSIGEYFKKEAITWAWEFLTHKNWLAINPEKLFITVYSEDQDAYDIWKNDIKIHPDKLIKGTKKTNFWDVGQGPCGPNSEIFYDRGKKYDTRGSELIAQDLENDRFIEIWNIVFSEFNNDGNGNYSPLPQKNIDTGAGLERIVAISQDVPTNFDSDLFLDLINLLEKYSPKYKYEINNYFKKDLEQEKINQSFKIIVDHIRTVVFAISDGAIPSNKERGYILRRLIRRSIIHGMKLEIDSPFLSIFVSLIAKKMGHFYPNLVKNKELIISVINTEENKFNQLILEGQKHFKEIIKKYNTVPAKEAFKLFDTYGFPFEITKELCEEKNITLDKNLETDFKKLLNKHIELSRTSEKFSLPMAKQSSMIKDIQELSNEFVGYKTNYVQSKCIFLFQDYKSCTKINENEIGFAIFNKTPFFAESGGQSSDIGFIKSEDGECLIQVLDVQKSINNLHVHQIKVLEGSLTLNKEYLLSYDKNNRELISNNHTATHLLVAALNIVLGEEIKQAGSFLEATRLRFDFLTSKKLTKEIIGQVICEVNKFIDKAFAQDEKNIKLSEAKNLNITMNFEERYGEVVRVISYGDIQPELCGGTHVPNLKQIEWFDIISYENKGSGVYRIEAITTKNTIKQHYQEILQKESSSLHEDLVHLKQNNASVELQQKCEALINSEFNDFLSYEMFKHNLDIFKNETKMFFHNAALKNLDDKANTVSKEVQELLSNSLNTNKLLYVLNHNVGLEVLRIAALKLININQELIYFLVSQDNNFILITNIKNIPKYDLGKIFSNLKLVTEIKGGGKNNTFQGKMMINIDKDVLQKVLND